MESRTRTEPQEAKPRIRVMADWREGRTAIVGFSSRATDAASALRTANANRTRNKRAAPLSLRSVRHPQPFSRQSSVAIRHGKPSPDRRRRDIPIRPANGSAQNQRSRHAAPGNCFYARQSYHRKRNLSMTIRIRYYGMHAQIMAAFPYYGT